ncbi:hypothetical protein [Microbacterium thalli]|uniref:Uncharacterized protein n=1 Tax=Microbacterium thalli TaxID=3027921 RepID=A0ABT5SE83_9MICO|nr:hypothetical protein [Microbacterium thalli]MDD7961123.1 hypothetical protein [Microbacterium thalli]
MVFGGTVLSVAALLDQAHAAPRSTPDSHVGLRHSAAANAARCAELIAAGNDLSDSWRFGVLQTLDDYTSTLRRGGTQLAAQVFTEAPAPTGSKEIDAAFAALADHLAQRDGWNTPGWALEPNRAANRWFPSVPTIFRAAAERESPRAFRRRGIFITRDSLARA